MAWFAAQGIFVERVLTDNGSCYRSKRWAEAMANTDCRHKRTRRRRPQTNGKVERFNRTLLTEWAYARPYKSEQLRRKALPKWLHIYNHHRAHTTLGGQPPASRHQPVGTVQLVLSNLRHAVGGLPGLSAR